MESAARAWFGGAPALGRRVRVGPPGSEWLRIVGIVPDLPRLSGFGRMLAAVRPEPAYLPWLFRPIAQGGDVPPTNWPRRRCLDCAHIAMAVRVPEGSVEGATVQAIAAELRVLAPDLPVEVTPFLEEQLRWSTPAMLRRNRMALTGFAVLALALALLGLYAVVADDVMRRTREIGIRKALGARARDIVPTVARDSVVNAAAGVTAGVAAVILGDGLTAGSSSAERTPPLSSARPRRTRSCSCRQLSRFSALLASRRSRVRAARQGWIRALRFVSNDAA